MFLKEFSSRQMQREATVVLNAAELEPVIITRQKFNGYVLLTKSEYAKLIKKQKG